MKSNSNTPSSPTIGRDLRPRRRAEFGQPPALVGLNLGQRIAAQQTRRQQPLDKIAPRFVVGHAVVDQPLQRMVGRLASRVVGLGYMGRQ
jgi:hypothetical protein